LGLLTAGWTWRSFKVRVGDNADVLVVVVVVVVVLMAHY